MPNLNNWVLLQVGGIALDTTTITWASVAMAAVSAIATAVGGYLTFLTHQSRLSHETEINSLKQENAILKVQLEECKKDHERSEEDRTKLWEQIKKLESFIEAIHKQNSNANAQKAN